MGGERAARRTEGELASRLSRTARAGLVGLGAVVLLAAFALAASHHACARFAGGPPRVTAALQGEGPLRAGAGAEEIHVRYPLPLAGYGPGRSNATSAAMPLKARALVLEEGPLTVGIVELDLLLVPSRLAREIEARAASLGVPHLVVAASHAHSAIGGFDDRLVAEVAATGRFRPAVEAAIVDAAARALAQAKAALAPARIEVGSGDAGRLVRSRDAGLGVDSRIEKIAVSGEHGAIGELILLSAHPTLVPRDATRADPDYPGRVAAREEQRGEGVTFVLQSAVGNASAQVPGGPGPMTERFVHALAPKIEAIATVPADATLRFSEAELPLPAPDASRLAPRWFAPFGRGLLCAAAPSSIAIRRVQLGGIALVAIPGEPTAPVAHALEAAADARVIAVADGYVGYLDTCEDVARRAGESRRQYFGAGLEDALIRAARLTRSP